MTTKRLVSAEAGNAGLTEQIDAAAQDVVDELKVIVAAAADFAAFKVAVAAWTHTDVAPPA